MIHEQSNLCCWFDELFFSLSYAEFWMISLPNISCFVGESLMLDDGDKAHELHDLVSLLFTLGSSCIREKKVAVERMKKMHTGFLHEFFNN